MARLPSQRATVRLAVDGSQLKHWDGDLKTARQLLKDQAFEASKALGPQILEESIRTAQGVGKQAAKAAENSIRVQYNKVSTTIMLRETPEVAFAFGAEYGSMRYPQFKPWRGNADKAGYFMWPSIRHQMTVHNERVDAKVDDILRKPFPE